MTTLGYTLLAFTLTATIIDALLTPRRIDRELDTNASMGEQDDDA